MNRIWRMKKKVLLMILILLTIVLILVSYYNINIDDLVEDKNILFNSDDIYHQNYSDLDTIKTSVDDDILSVYVLKFGPEDGQKYFDAWKYFYDFCSKNELTREIYDYYCENYPKDSYYKNYDIDEDGLSNYEEYEVYGSDPNKFSTSGDNVSDGFKALNDLDINKYYKPFWIKCRDNFYIKRESAIDSFKEGFGQGPFGIQNFLGLKDVYLIYLPYVGRGTLVKFNLPDVDMSTLDFEIFSTTDYVREEIEYKYKDGFIEFEARSSEDSYLLYPKGYEFDLQDWYLNHLEDKNAVKSIDIDTGYKEFQEIELTFDEKYILDYDGTITGYVYDESVMVPFDSELNKNYFRICDKYNDLIQMKQDLEDGNYDKISRIYDFIGLEGDKLEAAQRKKLELLIKLAKEYIINKEVDYIEQDYDLSEERVEIIKNHIEKIKNSDVVNE